MNEKPIIFNTEMVKAILAGNKTQTRRIIKPQPEYINGRAGGMDIGDPIIKGKKIKCPYYIDQVLWVRETYAIFSVPNTSYIYKANPMDEFDAILGNCIWKPSIYMPRKAARIFLRVKDIRIERIQDILVDDCIKEGIERSDPRYSDVTIKSRFQRLWNSINEKRGYGWAVNPFVWVIEFERIKDYESNNSQIAVK